MLPQEDKVAESFYSFSKYLVNIIRQKAAIKINELKNQTKTDLQNLLHIPYGMFFHKIIDGFGASETLGQFPSMCLLSYAYCLHNL